MLTLRLYTLAGLCGAVLMALEILASRFLAPHFGNSVYVWGSLISVFLGALSIGYSWGGRIADRHPQVVVLGRILLAAGIWMLGLKMWGAPLTSEIELPRLGRSVRRKSCNCCILRGSSCWPERYASRNDS